MNIQYTLQPTEAERDSLFRLRYEVFVNEQKVPADMEKDEEDATAIHVVAKDDDEIVGTGRLVIEQGHIGIIGRMAVKQDKRGLGIGKRLILELEKAANANPSIDELYLHAQTHAKSFYVKLGYTPRGNEFDEAGIAHIEMYKTIEN